MKKVLISAALLALAGQVSAAPVLLELDAHNQRSSSGSLSTLRWEGCANFAAHTSCINPGNAGIIAAGVTASTAVWTWDAATGVLSMTGNFNTISTLGSSAFSSAVIGDKVTNMTIDTVADTTSATAYSCGEGNFLAGVGANGCANVGTGGNFTYESSMAYNVGGNANCVQRTLGGDDVSTGNPRTLANTAGGGGCSAGDGAFNLWIVVQDNLGSNGTLILSNNADLAAAGVNYLTFSNVPVPGAVWLLGSALGGLAWVRRRARA